MTPQDAESRPTRRLSVISPSKEKAIDKQILHHLRPLAVARSSAPDQAGLREARVKRRRWLLIFGAGHRVTLAPLADAWPRPINCRRCGRPLNADRLLVHVDTRLLCLNCVGQPVTREAQA
jgi:hypothetical protein